MHNVRRCPIHLIKSCGFICFLISQSICFCYGKTILPLPRFASIKATKVNLRAGPGNQHPIMWTYKKQFLPVMIIAEYDNWRQIEDHEGTTGWVHHSMLSGKRYVMCLKKHMPLLSSPNRDATVQATLDINLIALIKEIKPTAVYVKVDSYKGWVNRNDIWGILKTE